MWGGTCTGIGVGMGMTFMAFESRRFQRTERVLDALEIKLQTVLSHHT